MASARQHCTHKWTIFASSSTDTELPACGKHRTVPSFLKLTAEHDPNYSVIQQLRLLWLLITAPSHAGTVSMTRKVVELTISGQVSPKMLQVLFVAGEELLGPTVVIWSLHSIHTSPKVSFSNRVART
jgi:hypothetical protein